LGGPNGAYSPSLATGTAPHPSGVCDGGPVLRDVETVPAQCIYYDAGLCRQAAGQLAAGECVVNQEEVRLTPSIGAYCLVTSTRASQCIYPDLETCSKEANRQNATCTVAAVRPGTPGVDPFALTRPGNAGLFGTGGAAGPVTAPPADALRNPGH